MIDVNSLLVVPEHKEDGTNVFHLVEHIEEEGKVSNRPIAEFYDAGRQESATGTLIAWVVARLQQEAAGEFVCFDKSEDFKMPDFMCTVEDGADIYFYQCPNRDHYTEDVLERSSGVIPRYYSHKHAYDSGWRFTTDKKWSKGGNTVGVCPACSKGEFK